MSVDTLRVVEGILASPRVLLTGFNFKIVLGFLWVLNCILKQLNAVQTLKSFRSTCAFEDTDFLDSPGEENGYEYGSEK